MDHPFIEKHNIADLYLLGKLPDEERNRFEEHFIDCPECIDHLETTDSLLDGLKTLAIEEAVQSHAYLLPGIFAWAARLSRGRQAMLLLGAILLLVALPTAILVTEVRRVRGELDQAKLANADGQRQAEEKRQIVQRLEQELHEAQQQSAEQKNVLAESVRQLRVLQEMRPRMADEDQQSGRLHSIATVFSLVNTRSAEPTQPPAESRVVISRSSQLIVLSLEFDPDPSVQSYRGTLTSDDNRAIWQGNKLRLNPKGTIEIGFGARLFKPGNYLLALEGLTKQGHYIPISKYSFRVILK